MELLGFQEKAASQIADRFATYSSDPLLVNRTTNVPFLQTLVSITGSGKTLMLADAISQIRDGMPIAPIVLWISKGRVVVSQTFETVSPRASPPTRSARTCAPEASPKPSSTSAKPRLSAAPTASRWRTRLSAASASSASPIPPSPRRAPPPCASGRRRISSPPTAVRRSGARSASRPRAPHWPTPSRPPPSSCPAPRSSG